MHIQSLTLALFSTVAISAYALPSTLSAVPVLDDLVGSGDGSSLLKRGAVAPAAAPAAPAAAPATKPSSHKHGRGRKHKSHTHATGKGHAGKKVAQKDVVSNASNPVSGASSVANAASSPLSDGATNALGDPTSMLSDPSSMLGSLPVVGDLMGNGGSGASPLDGVTSMLGGL